jgi:protein involved in polysaccharide export with SLBB domain
MIAGRWHLINPRMRINLNTFLKGQRMSEVVLNNHRSSESRSRWTGGLLFTSVLGVFLCGVIAAQSCDAQAADQVGNQAPYQQTGQSTDQQTMSAEQIIDLLRQKPDILASVKIQAAQQSGVDPSTISDETIYDRIRQDASLRDFATKELTKRGYGINLAAPNQNPANALPSKRAAPQPPKPSGTQARPYEEPDEPQEIQRPSPYGNLPSLHDLYTQIPSSGGKLRRFGSDAFLLGTGNANELPMDLPVGPDYVLGVGDSLAVNMWGGRSDRLTVLVDRQGQIALPEAGTITIDGLTIAQAQSAIQKALSTQFQGEHVEISLGRLRTVRVYVVGDVQRPGAYDVSSLSTPLSALYAAGGPTSRGSLRILRQYRSKQLVREIDLYDFLLRGVRSNVDRLLPGDTIMVPPVGSQVSVEGMVHRPAIYELNGEQGLNQVLDLAGGVLPSASLKQINVERIEAHQRRTMFSLQLPDNAEGVKQKLADFRVQSGDDVVISQILPYNEQAVYVEGHVYRPGKYPYRDGMTINDLLHSYQDVMPEPADHAELVRLQPPDFRPETISFSLPDVLIGNDSIKLQPFDLIRIFSRYEIDSPKVSIEGEVLRPGEFPMSQGMTLADLVRMAGGFKRSAYRDEADLSSYVVQNGQKVLVNHSIVAVEKALEGDKSADVVLKPGNVVSIRRLAGWQDIGASVTINGEVEHAGGYGIEQGERLSSVLKRAGGFRESAYPAAAVLEREQVRELGEQARQQMILRIETTPVDFKPGAMSEQAQSSLQQSLLQQRQHILATLRSRPASGRLVINISPDIGKWENTSADIEMRAGDTLVIPKRPNFVMVSGQVYNPTAISYVPGREAGWYLRKAGGATPYGDKKHIYVLRADGSVVAHGGNSWTGGNLMNLRLRPGDSVFVPEKIIGGSPVWQNIIGMAQIMSAATLPLAIGGVL